MKTRIDHVARHTEPRQIRHPADPEQRQRRIGGDCDMSRSIERISSNRAKARVRRNTSAAATDGARQSRIWRRNASNRQHRKCDPEIADRPTCLP